MERLTGAMEGGGEGWQERVAEVWRDLTGRREFAGMPQGERDGVLEQVSGVLTIPAFRQCVDEQRSCCN